jgi:hypothetical protein
MITFPFHFLRVHNAELVLNLFRECSELDDELLGLCKDDEFYTTIISLIFTAIVKFLLTIITFGAKIPAGIL